VANLCRNNMCAPPETVALILRLAFPSGLRVGFCRLLCGRNCRLSRNCSWWFPQDSTSELCKLLNLLMPKCGDPLFWAQGVGRSNRPAPTIRKQLIYLHRLLSARLAHL
jgi:hypothetical protein